MNHAGPAPAATPAATDAPVDPVWDVTLLLTDVLSGNAPRRGDTNRGPWATDYEEIE